MTQESATQQAQGLLAALPAPRIAPFLHETDGDAEKALDLYRWSHQMAADSLTVISHVEVLLRHRIDSLLAEHFDERHRHIPWFMQPATLDDRQPQDLQRITDRLVRRGKLARDQIIASTDLGFWAAFFSSGRQELWDRCLHRGFDKRVVKERKDVSTALEKLRTFRNRVAHHDSLLRTPVHEEMANLRMIADALDVSLSTWIFEGSTWEETYAGRPAVSTDTVIVPRHDAWRLYRRTAEEHELGAAFYLCRPGRSFRDVQRLGFYAQQAVQSDLPFIIGVRDNVSWTRAHAQALTDSVGDDRVEKKIGRFIAWTLDHPDDPAVAPFLQGEGMAGRYKVFVLTRDTGDSRHTTLPAPLPHRTSGRGSGFVKRQRYVSSHRLLTASSTRDLDGD